MVRAERSSEAKYFFINNIGTRKSAICLVKQFGNKCHVFVITYNIFCSYVEWAAKRRHFFPLKPLVLGSIQVYLSIRIYLSDISSLISDPCDMLRVSRFKRDTVLQGWADLFCAWNARFLRLNCFLACMYGLILIHRWPLSDPIRAHLIRDESGICPECTSLAASLNSTAAPVVKPKVVARMPGEKDGCLRPVSPSLIWFMFISFFLFV